MDRYPFWIGALTAFEAGLVIYGLMRIAGHHLSV
jgi:hypothetical protein